MTTKMNGKSSNTKMIKRYNEREKRERKNPQISQDVFYSINVSSVTFAFDLISGSQLWWTSEAPERNTNLQDN